MESFSAVIRALNPGTSGFPAQDGHIYHLLWWWPLKKCWQVDFRAIKSSEFMKKFFRLWGSISWMLITFRWTQSWNDPWSGFQDGWRPWHSDRNNWRIQWWDPWPVLLTPVTRNCVFIVLIVTIIKEAMNLVVQLWQAWMASSIKTCKTD